MTEWICDSVLFKRWFVGRIQDDKEHNHHIGFTCGIHNFNHDTTFHHGGIAVHNLEHQCNGIVSWSLVVLSAKSPSNAKSKSVVFAE